MTDKRQTSDVLRILHGARSLPPVPTEALSHFWNRSAKARLAMHLARAAVTELARSLKENHATSNDLWQEAIDATLSYANEVGWAHEVSFVALHLYPS